MRIIRDYSILAVWFLISSVIGLIWNEMSAHSIPLIYMSPSMRVDRSIAGMAGKVSTFRTLQGDVDVNEMSQIVASGSALVLDARPGVFYELGHIPTARSLPRDDFEKQYKNSQHWLEEFKDKPIIVYCSELDCHDSSIVGDALIRLGFKQVHLFRGGWQDWQAMGFPEEKKG